MRITSITIGWPVSDPARSAAWYRRLLGAVEAIEPMPGLTELELPASAWLQLMTDEKAPVLRIGVDDLAAARSELEARGIEVGSARKLPLSQGGTAILLADLADPDGNRLCLYEIKAL